MRKPVKRPVYKGWFGRHARNRCPHAMLEPVYGDKVNEVGGWRLWCLGCRRYLNGPVSLAEERSTEGWI